VVQDGRQSGARSRWKRPFDFPILDMLQCQDAAEHRPCGSTAQRGTVGVHARAGVKSALVLPIHLFLRV